MSNIKEIYDSRNGGQVGYFSIHENEKHNYDKQYKSTTRETIVGNILYVDEIGTGRRISERTLGNKSSYTFDEEGHIVSNKSEPQYMSSYDRTKNTTSAEAMWIIALCGAFIGGFFIHSIWGVSVLWSLILGAILSPLMALAIVVIIPLFVGSVGGALVGAFIGYMGHENVHNWACGGAIIGFICGIVYLWKLKNDL